MRGDGIAATAVLGLPGFVVLAVSEYAGELELAVETTASESWCFGCGVWARLHDRRPSWVRDLPAAGRSVTLVRVKRVWRCVESRCPRRTWTETAEVIRPRAAWTKRARREACRRVGELGQTVAAVAAEFGVGWDTVMAAVRDYGRPLVDDPARLDGVHTLGVDETAFLAATPTAGTTFATGIVALNGRARLLDVVEGRSGTASHDWVSGRDQGWRDRISVAAPDRSAAMPPPYAPAIPAGTHQVRMEFAYDGGGLGKGGNVTLYYDGTAAGTGRVEATQPMVFSADETTDIGCAHAGPESWRSHPWGDLPSGDASNVGGMSSMTILRRG